MSKILITVVVPIYNVERYLSRCIESIINQSYKNLEIILIDDGSIDRSGEICDEFSKKDNRIVVIHKKNEGVGKARNDGINLAKGEYIQFIDSDDYISPNMVQYLYEAISKDCSDISICGIKTFNYLKSKKKYECKNVHHMKNYPKRIDIIKYLEVLSIYNTSVFFGSPDNKLFRLKTIKENSIFFEESSTLGEDFLFNIKLLDKIKRISNVNKCLYYYRLDTEKSLTKKKRDSVYVLGRYYKFYVEFKKLYVQKNIYLQYKKNISDLLLKGVFLALLEHVKNGQKFEEYKNLFEEAQKYKESFFGSSNKKYRFVEYCIKNNKARFLYVILHVFYFALTAYVKVAIFRTAVEHFKQNRPYICKLF